MDIRGVTCTYVLSARLFRIFYLITEKTVSGDRIYSIISDTTAFPDDFHLGDKVWDVQCG